MLVSEIPTSGPDLEVEIRTTLALCDAIGSPRAITIRNLLLDNRYEEYLSLECNPDHYRDPGNFADDYLLTEVLKKSSALPLGRDLEAGAVQSFFEAEERCSDTNDRMFAENHPVWFSDFKRMIARILGPLTSSRLNRMVGAMRFGPGATTNVKGFGLVLSYKFDKQLTLTEPLYPFFRSIVGDNWWFHQSGTHEIVSGNKFTTVPKNAKQRRGICVEPPLNIWCQLGVGADIRKCLKRFGFDLDDQGVNQRLAMLANKLRLATIDLSQASDSTARLLVSEAFPEEWNHLLCLSRCERTQIDGESVHLEKFSSMGNGYTFEVESLIFTALALTMVPAAEWAGVSVYGDDIIVPQRYASTYIEALNYLGFEVNRSKSFLAGDFFESCGTDWFKGQNVRPFYLRGSKFESSKVPYSVQIANRLRDYAHRRGFEVFCDDRFRPLWEMLKAASPKVWRQHPIPAILGDTGLHVALSEGRPIRHHYGDPHRSGWEGFRVKHLRCTPVRKDRQTPGVLLAGLRTIGPDRDPSLGMEPMRGFLGRIRSKKTDILCWSEGYEWDKP